MRGNGILVVGALAVAAWMTGSAWIISQTVSSKPTIDTVAKRQKAPPIEMTGMAQNDGKAKR